MKICILGDTHFGMRGDSLEFHSHYSKFYTNVFFPYLNDNGINTIFQLGDLFDRRKFINFQSLYLCRNYFFDKLLEENIQFHTLLGNHDIAFKNTLRVNSTSLLLNDYNNIHIHDKFKTMDFGGIDIDIVPWICEENEIEIHTNIKDTKSQICFGHFEIDGFEMDRGTVCVGGMNKSVLNNYDIVLSGHFHHKSSDGNIHYVGTPGEMTWADYNDVRGFHIFDTDTRELKFIENSYKMFHKIFYDDGKTDFEFWKNYDYNKYKNTYLKVVVICKQNPYLFDTVLDNLYKAEVTDISIVEDFTDTNIDIDDDIVNQAEDTMSILSNYIDGATLDVNNEKLKTIMRELYVEAVNAERSE